MRKRGQITLFIIIGLVLLLTAVLVIYVATTRVTKPIEEELVQVPAGAEPVNEYISTCVYDTSKQAIELIGLQGGYLTMPAKIEKTPNSFLPMDSAGIIKIPYWYYEGEDRIPNLRFIENEISRYLYEHLPECLDFTVFEAKIDVSEKGPLIPKTILTDEGVMVELKWPIEIKTGGKTIIMDRFVNKVPVRLKKMLELASKTMDFENQKQYFENLTIDMMAGDEKIPMNGMEVYCGVKRWHITDVKERLQTLLRYNLPLIRIENTNYLDFMESRRDYTKLEKERQRIYNDLSEGKEFRAPGFTIPDAYEFFKMTPDVGIAPIDLKAHFTYRPEWGIELIARPHDGGVLKSSKMKGVNKYLSYLCINQWHFVYDVIYPVLMVIKDDTAFKGEGYMFQFGFPVLINNNQGARDVFGYKNFEFSTFGGEFCELVGGDEVEIRAYGLEPGMLFSTELNDVKIGYQCIDEYCELGKTSADEGIYRLRTILPEGCGNPLITAEKDGYLSARAQLSGNKADLKMTKLKKFDLDVIVHPYDSITKTWRDEDTRELRKNEKVVIGIELVNSSFEQYKQFPEQKTLELVEGDSYYDINMILTKLEQPTGGYDAKEVKINYNEMKNTIELHVFEYIPLSEDKTDMMRFLFEGDYREKLKPSFR